MAIRRATGCTAWLPVALSCLLAGCVASGGEGGAVKPARFEPQGEGPFQRFIVRYRDGSAAAATRDDVQTRIARTVDKAGLDPPVVPTWQRRLAVQADVFALDRPLDRAGATALMQAFATDPDVEYIEVDAMSGIGPVPPRRPMRPAN